MSHAAVQAVWVDPDAPLPDPRQANADGLVAVGRDLSVARLREAYALGMFPWFNAGDPVLWWCPDPRLVLACADFKVSRSLGKKLRQMLRMESGEQPVNQTLPVVTTNLAFAQVIAACAAPRGGREDKAQSTWIGASIQRVYTAWHQTGGAHSVEVWQGGELTGGLYGVCLGRMFFGESMFSRVSDASKLALAYLVARLRRLGIEYIDCQQQTAHLRSLGARVWSRTVFLEMLAQATTQSAPVWGRGRLLADGRLADNARHE